jgi:organic radical activating enzyme
MFKHNRLEIHAANSCNFTCESCSHFSNGGHKGILSVQEAESWMKKWNKRIDPKTFRILGGEPLINPNINEIIYLARECWAFSDITLVTNGFLLHKHPHLPMALEACDVELSISIHDNSAEYMERKKANDALLEMWKSSYDFRLSIYESYHSWTRRHRGTGAFVMPYEDGAPRESWNICPARECHQLFRGKLWKCPSIAYLKLQKDRYPDLSPVWNDYLAYEGLDPSCSDEELDAFLSKEEEAICGMCPSNREKFKKPSPLIPLGALLNNRNN